jgi:hypothetical protein
VFADLIWRYAEGRRLHPEKKLKKKKKKKKKKSIGTRHDESSVHHLAIYICVLIKDSSIATNREIALLS